MSIVLASAAALAALACPAHMLWRLRRGHGAGCLPGRIAESDVQQRQRRLARDLARLGGDRS
jgi:hypothetical protein